MRAFLVNLLKLALVAGLIWWLVSSGKLDFKSLAILVSDPAIFAINLTLWIVACVGLGTLRWHLLLRGLDLEVPFFRAMRFQLIGLFFNTAMPGAVGGDVIKAIYVIREQQEHGRTKAMLTVLLDRVIGLAALFVLAGATLAANLGFFMEAPALAPVAAFVVVGLLGMVLGLILVVFPHAEGKDPIAKLLSRKLPGFNMLGKIYEALRCYRHRPMILIGTVGLSCVIQVGYIAYAYLVMVRLTGQAPPAGVFGTIYAVGIMTTAIPLAPGGLGVGHVAFDKLFQLAGLTGGANIFNIYALGQLTLNLTGFIPYLLHKTRTPAASPDQALVKGA